MKCRPPESRLLIAMVYGLLGACSAVPEDETYLLYPDVAVGDVAQVTKPDSFKAKDTPGSVDAGPPPPEQCKNLLDDDGDGLVDEDCQTSCKPTLRPDLSLVDLGVAKVTGKAWPQLPVLLPSKEAGVLAVACDESDKPETRYTWAASLVPPNGASVLSLISVSAEPSKRRLE